MLPSGRQMPGGGASGEAFAAARRGVEYLVSEVLDLLTLLADFRHRLNADLQMQFGPSLSNLGVGFLGLDAVWCNRYVRHQQQGASS